MTRSEAISYLKEYRRDRFKFYRHCILIPKKDTFFKEISYGNSLIDILIDEIRQRPGDPIKVVGEVYSEFDTVLCESDDDHLITHNFAALMELLTGEILEYLRGIERRKQNGKN